MAAHGGGEAAGEHSTAAAWSNDACGSVGVGGDEPGTQTRVPSGLACLRRAARAGVAAPLSPSAGAAGAVSMLPDRSALLVRCVGPAGRGCRWPFGACRLGSQIQAGKPAWIAAWIRLLCHWPVPVG